MKRDHAQHSTQQQQQQQEQQQQRNAHKLSEQNMNECVLRCALGYSRACVCAGMADGLAFEFIAWFRKSVDTLKCLLPPNHKLYRDIEKKCVAATLSARRAHPHLNIPEPGPLRPSQS